MAFFLVYTFQSLIHPEETFRVVSFQTRANQPCDGWFDPDFQICFVSSQALTPKDYLQKVFVLQSTAQSFYGLITALRIKPPTDGMFLYEASLASPWAALNALKRGRVWVDSLLSDILAVYLQEHQQALPEKVVLALSLEQDRRIPVFIQQDETDWSALKRLLSEQGLWIEHGVVGEKQVYRIVDKLSQAQPRRLVYNSASAAIVDFEWTHQSHLAETRLRYYRSDEPEQPSLVQVLSQVNTQQGIGYQTKVISSPESKANIERQAKLEQARQDTQACFLRLSLRQEAWGVGHILSLENSPIARLNGLYRVVSVSHRYQAKQTDKIAADYLAQLDLRPVEAPWVLPKPNKIPQGLMTVQLEDGDLKQALDAQGLYRFVYGFEHDCFSQHRSPSAPLLQIWASQLKDSQGFHWRLAPKTRVELLFWEGDLRYPLILGAYQDSPFKTAPEAAEEGFCLDKLARLVFQHQEQTEKLSLEALETQDNLSLDVEGLKLSSPLGQGQIEAGAGYRFQSQSYFELHGSEYQALTEGSMQFKAETLDWEIQGECHFSAPMLRFEAQAIESQTQQDSLFSGGEVVFTHPTEERHANLACIAKEDVLLEASELHWRADEAFVIEQNGACIRLVNGQLSLESPLEIRISAETLIIEGAQSRAGAEFDIN